MNNQIGSCPLLSSERLLLRKINLNDANEIFYLRSNSEVNKYIIRPLYKEIEEAESFILNRSEDIEANNLFVWAITLKGSPKLIGSICLWNIDWTKKYAETGYDLHPDFQKQGIMNESMKLVLDFGFNLLQLNTIEAFTHKDNLGSIQLLKRNNFTHEINRIDEGFPHNIIFSLDRSK
ncbi:MAG: ribosomal-protein-alanine N-acetyltransferase [Flavobacteriaceae bacterium]|jgi:ribosomal-protein-alanine N-acetyltransferase|uniref:GNAT family N-acetyltransferase n=1 Tax=Candidatus Marifrigoribacter sp. Uisw_064 TaxID=3230970 RepID=UPI003AEA328E